MIVRNRLTCLVEKVFPRHWMAASKSIMRYSKKFMKIFLFTMSCGAHLFRVLTVKFCKSPLRVNLLQTYFKNLFLIFLSKKFVKIFIWKSRLKRLLMKIYLTNKRRFKKDL